MYPEGSEKKIFQAVDVYPSKSKAEAEVIIKTEKRTALTQNTYSTDVSKSVVFLTEALPVQQALQIVKHTQVNDLPTCPCDLQREVRAGRNWG